MSLAALIATRRAERGLSLQKVADAAGCTKAHIWDMERGGSVNPCVSTLVGLGNALSVPASELFAAACGGEPPPTDQATALLRDLWHNWNCPADAAEGDIQQASRDFDDAMERTEAFLAALSDGTGRDPSPPVIDGASSRDDQDQAAKRIEELEAELAALRTHWTSRSGELKAHPYLPDIEDVVAALRAAISKASPTGGEGS